MASLASACRDDTPTGRPRLPPLSGGPKSSDAGSCGVSDSGFSGFGGAGGSPPTTMGAYCGPKKPGPVRKKDDGAMLTKAGISDRGSSSSFENSEPKHG